MAKQPESLIAAMHLVFIAPRHLHKMRQLCCASTEARLVLGRGSPRPRVVYDWHWEVMRWLRREEVCITCRAASDLNLLSHHLILLLQLSIIQIMLTKPL